MNVVSLSKFHARHRHAETLRHTPWATVVHRTEGLEVRGQKSQPGGLVLLALPSGPPGLSCTLRAFLKAGVLRWYGVGEGGGAGDGHAWSLVATL